MLWRAAIRRYVPPARWNKFRPAARASAARVTAKSGDLGSCDQESQIEGEEPGNGFARAKAGYQEILAKRRRYDKRFARL